MMAPDDPRHGTHRGYQVGCREDCCRRAQALYMNLYRMGRRPRLIDPTGTRRRIQALMALGWATGEIAARLGHARTWPHTLIQGERRVRSDTAAQIAALYDELCMTVPQHPHAARCRRLAAAAGYFPPLAWNDIDDPDETPTLDADNSADDYDQAVVERVLGGEWRLPSSDLERTEICRRWFAAGHSLRDLEHLTGFRPDRYFHATDGAAA